MTVVPASMPSRNEARPHGCYSTMGGISLKFASTKSGGEVINAISSRLATPVSVTVGHHARLLPHEDVGLEPVAHHHAALGGHAQPLQRRLHDQRRRLAREEFELAPRHVLERGNGATGVGDAAAGHGAHLVGVGGKEARPVHQRLVGGVELAIVERAVKGHHHGVDPGGSNDLHGVLVEELGQVRRGRGRAIRCAALSSPMT